jgi:hypothetical protein
MRRCLFVSVTALALALWSSPAVSASAIAFDSGTGAWAYRHGYPSAADAERVAMDSCRRRGGRACTVVASCDGAGYGMVYDRRNQGGRSLVLGAACGAQNPREANEVAKRSCNEQLGRLSGNCGGPLGQCRCGGPRVSWRD